MPKLIFTFAFEGKEAETPANESRDVKIACLWELRRQSVCVERKKPQPGIVIPAVPPLLNFPFCYKTTEQGPALNCLKEKILSIVNVLLY